MSPVQIDSLKTELVKAREDTDKVKLYMQLGNEIGYSDQAKAIEYGKLGYELSKKINYEMGKGRTSYLLATSYMDLGDFNKTDSFLAISENSFQALKNTRYLTMITNARGTIHFMKGNYRLAAKYLTEAAEGFDVLKDTSSAFVAYSNLIAVMGNIKHHEKAVELSKKLLTLAEAIKDSLQIGYSLQAIVTDLIYLGKYNEAASYTDRLLQIGNTTGDQNLSAEIFSTLGTYQYKLSHFNMAATYFRTAVKKAAALSNNFQLANHYNSLGQALYRLRDFNAAGESLDKSLRLSRQYKNKRAESNAYLSLSTLYDSLGDYKKAYSNLLHHMELADSLLNGETRNYISSLEIEFETNRKETEILRLQKIQQQNDFEIRKRNTYIGIGISLIIILAFILYLLRRNAKNRQKIAFQQNQVLEEKLRTLEKEHQITSLQSMITGQETERTRIAQDLHDGLGGIFSTVKMHYSTLQRDTPAISENPLYKKTLDLINAASEELRRVAHDMMPEVLLKVGLVEALRDFCNNISMGKLIKITFQDFGMEKRLGASTEIMLFRIIQELINNIIKHAGASEAIIQINREQNRLSLTIEDNGSGFDTREVEEKRSMGIYTVKSRVEYLNGKLTIDSRKNIGTTVMIDLLINN